MSFILQNTQDGVHTITLNRADLHNAFNDDFIAELTQAFKTASLDKKIRLVILDAVGKSFCAGADLNWMKSMVKYSMQENINDSKKLSELFHAINFCEKPVLAKVQGAALGGGVGLVSACDYVFASEEASFGLTEVRLGLIPAVISPFVIAKIGESNARAYFMSGERFTALDAQRIGLVHQVCKASELETKFNEVVESFKKAAPEAAMIAKKLIFSVKKLSIEDSSLKKAQDFTCQQIAERRISNEGQEGMNALLEKRKASWLK